MLPHLLWLPNSKGQIPRPELPGPSHRIHHFQHRSTVDPNLTPSGLCLDCSLSLDAGHPLLFCPSRPGSNSMRQPEAAPASPPSLQGWLCVHPASPPRLGSLSRTSASSYPCGCPQDLAKARNSSAGGTKGGSLTPGPLKAAAQVLGLRAHGERELRLWSNQPRFETRLPHWAAL